MAALGETNDDYGEFLNVTAADEGLKLKSCAELEKDSAVTDSTKVVISDRDVAATAVPQSLGSFSTEELQGRQPNSILSSPSATIVDALSAATFSSTVCDTQLRSSANPEPTVDHSTSMVETQAEGPLETTASHASEHQIRTPSPSTTDKPFRADTDNSQFYTALQAAWPDPTPQTKTSTVDTTTQSDPPSTKHINRIPPSTSTENGPTADELYELAPVAIRQPDSSTHVPDVVPEACQGLEQFAGAASVRINATSTDGGEIVTVSVLEVQQQNGALMDFDQQAPGQSPCSTAMHHVPTTESFLSAVETQQNDDANGYDSFGEFEFEETPSQAAPESTAQQPVATTHNTDKNSDIPASVEHTTLGSRSFQVLETETTGMLSGADVDRSFPEEACSRSEDVPLVARNSATAASAVVHQEHAEHSDDDGFGDFEDAPIAAAPSSAPSATPNSSSGTPSTQQLELGNRVNESEFEFEDTSTRQFEAENSVSKVELETAVVVTHQIDAAQAIPGSTAEPPSTQKSTQELQDDVGFGDFEDAPTVQSPFVTASQTQSQTHQEGTGGNSDQEDDDFGDFEDAPTANQTHEKVTSGSCEQEDDDFGDFEDAPTAGPPLEPPPLASRELPPTQQVDSDVDANADDGFGDFEDAKSDTAPGVDSTVYPVPHVHTNVAVSSKAQVVDTSDLLSLKGEYFTRGCQQILEATFGMRVTFHHGLDGVIPSLDDKKREALSRSDTVFELLLYFGLPPQWDVMPFTALEWKGTVLEETFLDRLGLLDAAMEVAEQLRLEEDERARKEEEEKRKNAEAAAASAASRSAGGDGPAGIPPSASYSSLASDSAEGKLSNLFAPLDSKLNLSFVGRPDTPAEIQHRDNQPALNAAAIQPPMPKSLKLPSSSRPNSSGGSASSVGPSTGGSGPHLPFLSAEQFAKLASKLNDSSQNTGSNSNSIAEPAAAPCPTSLAHAPQAVSLVTESHQKSVVAPVLGSGSGHATILSADEKLVQDLVSTMPDMTYLFADELVYPKPRRSVP